MHEVLLLGEMSETRKKERNEDQAVGSVSVFDYIHLLPPSTVSNLSLPNPAFAKPLTNEEAKFCLALSRCSPRTVILGGTGSNQKRPTLDRMFASTSQRNDGLRASYNISLLIAKSGKPHTIGEKLILLAVEEVLKTVLHKPASDIIKRIPLSNNTVEIRIDEMSSDIESFLCNYLQTTHFSI
ncbi:unnamed protein product [Acanthoscelides obtectus]|uniref:Uncharacterized protein n=1 Tax=Acanthoscelides obtectus TaxID=200917 RepID=A0A9P0KFB9_ACAOB|nr:unnamed protein product [Acanthoscelides obtectus]CAK1632545.1 Protein ZBED8 [Acanthoscelides obtectus]